MTEIVDGIDTLIARFDGFILDQWGVLHRGAPADVEVRKAAAALRAAGKRVVLLSNSGKRAADNQARLAEWGLPAPLFDRVITSGEAAHDDLKRREDPFYAGIGSRCRLITRGGDTGVLADTGIDPVDTVATADFILLTGLDDDPAAARAAAGMLEEALARDLPLICANPDRVGLLPDGTATAPGELAARYRTRGGRVRFLGKPHPEIYTAVAAALDSVPPARSVAVGDSLEHDIAGGASFGAATCLVTTGIHADAFADPDRPTAAEAERLFEATGIRADIVLPRFRLG